MKPVPDLPEAICESSQSKIDTERSYLLDSLWDNECRFFWQMYSFLLDLNFLHPKNFFLFSKILAVQTLLK